METIKKHLQLLYPDKTEKLLPELERMMSYYNAIRPQNFQLSQQDAILIAYADSFKEEGSSGLQSLNAVCNQYLKESINSIHLLPFYPFTSDDGFSVVDYKKVNPEFGDWEDVANLNQNYHLMFDAVINHISKSSDWFQGYLNGEKEFENFFIEEDPKHPDLSKVTRPRVLPLLHKYQKKDGSEAFIWTTFSDDQVDLNYANPQVFLRVLDVLLFYISKGARLIRLDAIAFMWKRLGTSCIHLEETHRIIQVYRRILEKIAPQTVIITETNVPHQENISYFGNGENEAHMVYNFSLPPLLAYSLQQEDTNVLCKWAKSLSLPSDKTCFFNFTASHDGVGVRPLQGIVDDEEIKALAKSVEAHGGFVSYKTNADGSQSPYELNCNYMDLLTDPAQADDLRVQRFLLTQAVMLSMPGVPGIYYHSIFGSQNDVQAVLDSGINRRINRQKISQKDLEKELKDKESIRYKVYHRYSRLLQLRKQEKAFHPIAKADFENEHGVFAIVRDRKGEQIHCLFNFSDQAINIEHYSKGKYDIISGTEQQKELEAFGFVWLKNRA